MVVPFYMWSRVKAGYLFRVCNSLLLLVTYMNICELSASYWISEAFYYVIFLCLYFLSKNFQDIVCF